MKVRYLKRKYEETTAQLLLLLVAMMFLRIRKEAEKKLQQKLYKYDNQDREEYKGWRK